MNTPTDPTSQPGSKPAASNPPPARPGIVARIFAVVAALKALVQTIRNEPAEGPLTPQEEQLVKGMRAFIPKLARACADVMDLGGDIFKGFGFTANDLRDDEEEVRVTEENLIFVNGTVDDINNYYNVCKTRLVRRVLKVLEQVDNLRGLPVLPAGIDKDLLSAMGKPIDAVRNEANAQVQGTKKTNQHLKQQGQQKTAGVQADLSASQLENKVLRGQTLSSGEIVAATQQPMPQKGQRGSSKPAGGSSGKKKGRAGTTKKKG